MRPRGLICVLLSYTLLMCGCYSQSPLTKDEKVPAYEPVVFYLKDGSFVESRAYEHMRSATGFEVTGVRSTEVRGTSSYDEEPFSGLIADSAIQKVTANKFNSLATVGVVGGVIGAGIVAVAIYAASQPKMHGF